MSYVNKYAAFMMSPSNGSYFDSLLEREGDVLIYPSSSNQRILLGSAQGQQPMLSLSSDRATIGGNLHAVNVDAAGVYSSCITLRFSDQPICCDVIGGGATVPCAPSPVVYDLAQNLACATAVSNDAVWSLSNSLSLRSNAASLAHLTVSGFSDTADELHTWSLRFSVNNGASWTTFGDRTHYFSHSNAHVSVSVTFVYTPSQPVHVTDWQRGGYSINDISPDLDNSVLLTDSHSKEYSGSLQMSQIMSDAASTVVASLNGQSHLANYKVDYVKTNSANTITVSHGADILCNITHGNVLLNYGQNFIVQYIVSVICLCIATHKISPNDSQVFATGDQESKDLAMHVTQFNALEKVFTTTVPNATAAFDPYVKTLQSYGMFEGADRRYVYIDKDSTPALVFDTYIIPSTLYGFFAATLIFFRLFIKNSSDRKTAGQQVALELFKGVSLTVSNSMVVFADDVLPAEPSLPDVLIRSDITSRASLLAATYYILIRLTNRDLLKTAYDSLDEAGKQVAFKAAYQSTMLGASPVCKISYNGTQYLRYVQTHSDVIAAMKKVLSIDSLSEDAKYLHNHAYKHQATLENIYVRQQSVSSPPAAASAATP